MSAGSNGDAELRDRLVRLEVKIESLIQMILEDRERDKTAILDHETRIREIERAGDIETKLSNLNSRMTNAERWVHALPVGLVITFVIAVGGLVSYVGGITPS